MNESQNPLIVPVALLLIALPYTAAFYHNKLLCDKDPIECVAYEAKYTPERHNFNLNAALEQGMTKLEQIIKTYTQ